MRKARGPVVVRPDDCYTTNDVALLVQCSYQHIAKLCDRGVIGHHKLPGTRIRKIPGRSLAKFLREHRPDLIEDS